MKVTEFEENTSKYIIQVVKLTILTQNDNNLVRATNQIKRFSENSAKKSKVRDRKTSIHEAVPSASQ